MEMNYLIAISRLLPFVLLGVFFSCGQSNSSQEESAALTDQNADPDFFLYLVNIDQLRLRKEPTLSATDVQKIPQGSILFGEGVKSGKTVQLELDGTLHTAPFYEVSDASGTKGWAFGGSLSALYRGQSDEKPDVNRISECAAYLNSLDPKDFNSGGKAWAFLEEKFSDVNGSLADAIFVAMETFMHRVERKSGLEDITTAGRFSAAEVEAIFTNSFDPAGNSFAIALAANGFRLVAAEGLIFAVPDLRKFQEFFSPRVSHPMQRYLNQRTSEQRAPMLAKGKITVNLANLADLAVFWEKFNREYPKFLKSDETHASEHWYRNTVLRGTDKMPLFNPANNQVNMDYRLVWVYVQNELSGTETESLVSQMVQLCQENDWTRNKKIDDFLAKLQD
jgi:hypothetical protein